MYSLWNDFDRTLSAFDQLLREVEPAFARRGARRGLPLNISETEEAYTVVARVAGMKAEELTVETEGDVVILKGRRAVALPEGAQVLHRERADVHVERSLRFRTPIDREGITARLDKGLLTLRVPKAPEARPRRITVTTG